MKNFVENVYCDDTYYTHSLSGHDNCQDINVRITIQNHM